MREFHALGGVEILGARKALIKGDARDALPLYHGARSLTESKGFQNLGISFLSKHASLYSSVIFSVDPIMTWSRTYVLSHHIIYFTGSSGLTEYELVVEA